MNPATRAILDPISRALLYEGFILYPYRASVKNAQRVSSGTLYPEAFIAAHQPGIPNADNFFLQAQCLLESPADRPLSFTVRFLQMVERTLGRPTNSESFESVQSLQVDGQTYLPWQEAVEREISAGPIVLDALVPQQQRRPFSFPANRSVETIRDVAGAAAGLIIRQQQSLAGSLEISSDPLADDLMQLTVRLVNETALSETATHDRESAALRSLVCAHVAIESAANNIVSPTDSPGENIGVWPVLIGTPPARDFMLASPINLSDYPVIAPETPGDSFLRH